MKAVVEVAFEPVGTSFRLMDREHIWLELPTSALSEIEIVGWETGYAVWLPYPGEYRVFRSSGELLEEL